MNKYPLLVEIGCEDLPPDDVTYIAQESAEKFTRILKEKRIDFYYKDFREGFRVAHKLAKEKEMYCQNYCGCVFSIVEMQEAFSKAR